MIDSEVTAFCMYRKRVITFLTFMPVESNFLLKINFKTIWQVTAYPVFKRGVNVEEAIQQIRTTFPNEITPEGSDDTRKWQLYDDIRPFVHSFDSDSINVKDCGMLHYLTYFRV